MPRKLGTGKYDKSLTFSVEPDTFDRLHDVADAKNAPLSELLRDALEQYLQRESKILKLPVQRKRIAD